jgi:hypothetical protein
MNLLGKAVQPTWRFKNWLYNSMNFWACLIPQISMIPYGCCSHPLACSLCVWMSKSRIRSSSNNASLSHVGFAYTHIDIPDGDSTCHVVRR